MAMLFDKDSMAITYKSMLIKDLKTPIANRNVSKIYHEIIKTVKKY